MILYCSVGNRSAAAGQALRQLSYRRVYNLGALKDWTAAGYPVER